VRECGGRVAALVRRGTVCVAARRDVRVENLAQGDVDVFTADWLARGLARGA